MTLPQNTDLERLALDIVAHMNMRRLLSQPQPSLEGQMNEADKAEVREYRNDILQQVVPQVELKVAGLLLKHYPERYLRDLLARYEDPVISEAQRRFEDEFSAVVQGAVEQVVFRMIDEIRG